MRYKPVRWIPENSVTIWRPLGVAYLYQSKRGQPVAIVYGGKRNRPDWHVSFKTEERRNEAVEAWYAGLQSHEDRKANRKREKAEFIHTIEPGTILYNSWGYDQTNIDWYVVIQRSEKTVTIAPIAGRDVTPDSYGCAPMSGLTEPDQPVRITGQAMTKRVYPGNRVSMKHGGMSQYAGKPVYNSWYA